MRTEKIQVGHCCLQHSLANDKNTTTPRQPSQARVDGPAHTARGKRNEDLFGNSQLTGSLAEDIQKCEPQAESDVDLFPKLPYESWAHCQAHRRESCLRSYDLKNGYFTSTDKTAPLNRHRLKVEPVQVARAEERTSTNNSLVRVKRSLENEPKEFDEDETYSSDSGERVCYVPRQPSQLIKYTPPAHHLPIPSTNGMLGGLLTMDVESVSENAPAYRIANENEIFQEKEKPLSTANPYLGTMLGSMNPMKPMSMHLLDNTASKSALYVRALQGYDAKDEIRITFRPGDIIAVLKRRESGWWIGIAYSGDSWDGKVHGGRGLFPSNHCTLDLGEVSIGRWGREASSITGLDEFTQDSSIRSIAHIRATFDYKGRSERELSLRRGDTIQIIERQDSGWWNGISNGARGWFPHNYCEEVMGQAGGSSEAGEKSALEANTDDAVKEKSFGASAESNLLALSSIERGIVSTSKVQGSPKARNRTKTGCLSERMLRFIMKLLMADLK